VKKVANDLFAARSKMPAADEKNEETVDIWMRYRERYAQWQLYVTTDIGARRMVLTIFCISVLLLIISLRPWTWFTPQRLIYIPTHQHIFLQSHQPIKH
jgi:hypothetical protein